MAKMWAGRFSKELDKTADDFNSSIHFDCKMFRQDIRGSMAHAAMLGAQNIIPVEDANTIIEALGGILEDLESGKLAFDFDMVRLSQTLSAIAGCLSHPQLSITFTVKDATAINEEMLRSATINAKRKAEILCDASGAKLGNLIAIDYNWGELDIYSHTRFDCCEEAMAPMKACSLDIDPEDIDVSDTATFVWELV